jgi:hypothetical protein
MNLMGRILLGKMVGKIVLGSNMGIELQIIAIQ